jgi:hypothetical protein
MLRSLLAVAYLAIKLGVATRRIRTMGAPPSPPGGDCLRRHLTREWVCPLQLLLALADAVILGSESRWTLNLNGQFLVYTSPRKRVAKLKPPHSVTFSSSLTTRRTTVKVSPELSSVTLRLAAYCQSVRLGARPLENHDQIIFQLNSCGNSPYVTSSLTRRWVCPL